MKKLFFFTVIIFVNASFLSSEIVKNEPIYKIEFTGIDCYFGILINNKNVYKNENQYKVSKTLTIDQFLEKKDSQRIEYFFHNRHTTMELTEKSDFSLIITKHLGDKIDTIYQSNLVKKRFEDEKGKMKYPQRISHSGYFLLN